MGEGYTEIEGVEVNNLKDFPYSGIKVVGGIQMGLGLVCIVLGLADVMMFVFQESEQEISSLPDEAKDAIEMLKTLTLTSSPIWCGLWYIVTGAMSICMSENRKSTIYHIKITFLVLSILCATVFGPICLGISAVVAIMRHTLDPSNFRWMVPLLSAFFSLNEILFAIVSAAICCCCSPIRTSKIRLLVTQPQMDNGDKYMLGERERTQGQIDMFTTTDRYGRPLPLQRPTTMDSETSYLKLKRLALPSVQDQF